MAIDRCTDTRPHGPHRAQYGPFGVKDCPGVASEPATAPAQPRRIPTMEDRMTAARQLPIHGDRTAAQQMIADLTAERDALLRTNRQLAERLRDTRLLADLRQRIIGQHEQELAAAGRVVAAARQAVERIDRALAGRLPSLPDIRSAMERLDQVIADFDAGDGPDWSHEIAFDTDGDWSIGHPDGCPGQHGGDCDVAEIAKGELLGRYVLPAGRYECAVNDLGDRLLLGDRITTDTDQITAERDSLVETIGRLVNLPPEAIARMYNVGYSGASTAATLAQIAAERAQLDDDLAAGRVADRLGDQPPRHGPMRGAALDMMRLRMDVDRRIQEVERRVGEVEDRVDEMQMEPEYDPAAAGPEEYDVDGLLANVARSLNSARDDDERAEAIEMLLEGWYAAWLDSAVTDPHAPLASELVRLLGSPRPAQGGDLAR